MKRVNNWLWIMLASAIPFQCIQGSAPKDSAFETLLRKKKCNNNNQIIDLLEVLLVNQTVFFHDYAYGLLEGIQANFIIDDNFRLRQNAAAIGSALFPDNQEKAFQLAILLIDYISAGQEYVNTVYQLGTTQDPLVTQLLNAWILVANSIAIFLHDQNPCQIGLKKAQKLLGEYTLLLASIVNHLAPTAEIAPNFTEASQIYLDTNEFAATKLSRLFAEAART